MVHNAMVVNHTSTIAAGIIYLNMLGGNEKGLQFDVNDIALCRWNHGLQIMIMILVDNTRQMSLIPVHDRALACFELRRRYQHCINKGILVKVVPLNLCTVTTP